MANSAFAGPSSSSSAGVEDHRLRVILRSDLLATVNSSKVKITQGSNSKIYLTNAQGETPEFSVAPGVLVTMSLKQKNTPLGTCLGQKFLHQLASPPAGEIGIEILTVLQPLAEAVHVDSTVQFFQQSQFHGRWFLSPDENSSYSFPAEVGMLMTPREIYAFGEYYGISFDHSDYRLGIVFKTEDAEYVGFPGIDIGLRLDSYGFEEAPAADPYFVAFVTEDLASADYDVIPRAWSDVAPETVTFRLDGTLGKGLNLILLRQGTPLGLASHLAVPESFPPQAANAGGTAPLTNPVNCTPCPPDEDPLCSMTLPTDDAGCPASGGCGPVTAEDCTTTSTKIGPAVCGGATGGGTASGTFGVTVSVSGGAKVDLTIFGQGVEAAVGASVSTSASMTVAVGEGQGCGQCGQLFLLVTQCSKTCVVHKKVPCLACETHCMDTSETSSCLDITLDTRYCNRSGDGCPGDPPCPGG